ncbi:ribosome biogenesis GTPase Der [soil metagenome]
MAGPRTARARRAARLLEDEVAQGGLPLVALVGRPNVGKSTLFNRIVGRRQAIVEDRARTTRDRMYAVTEWNDRRFVVVDTGGLEVHPGDEIEAKVQDQARVAIAEADVIVLVVDAEAGQTPADSEAAELLRAAVVPVIVAANKADNQKRELEAAEFHRLGWPETHAISALHGRGTGDLLDVVVASLPPETPEEGERRQREEDLAEAEPWPILEPAAADDDGAAIDALDAGWVPRVAIVGRPPVGKSSLLNALLGEERTIVSDIPGTTRDTIDSALEWQGRPMRLVDTAGLRRRGKVAAGAAAERYSALRALRAIGRADVCVLVLDAQDGLAAQDAHVAGYVVDEGVGLVIAINKWDLIEKDDSTFDEYVARLRAEAPFLHFAPMLSISARTGQRTGRVLDTALAVARARRQRVATAALNKILSDAVSRHPPPTGHGRRPRFFYATQVSIKPPTFVLFASDAQAVHFSYKRFLENRLRDAFEFGGAPLRLVFRERSRVELEPRRKRPAARSGAPRRNAGRRAVRGGHAAS